MDIGATSELGRGLVTVHATAFQGFAKGLGLRDLALHMLSEKTKSWLWVVCSLGNPKKNLSIFVLDLYLVLWVDNGHVGSRPMCFVL